MKWVTRERPKIDRLACPWLIRRFIDVEAEIRYVPAAEVLTVAEREGAIHRRLDMDDPVRRVRVQPVDALGSLRNADERRDQDRPPVIEDREMLVDVNALALLRIAGDALDRLAHRLAARCRCGNEARKDGDRDS